jgi:hypothetical protein
MPGRKVIGVSASPRRLTRRRSMDHIAARDRNGRCRPMDEARAAAADHADTDEDDLYRLLALR